MYKIVLIRHGESAWNKKGLFTGWTDVALTSQGEKEARMAGRELRRRGFIFDLAFTSFLKRAARTLRLVLKERGLAGIPVRTAWQLNERHYGGLQGLSKSRMAEKFGADQVLLWRRGYAIRPPRIAPDSRYDQRGDIKYRGIPVPSRESLKDVVARVVPFWRREVMPEVKKGRQVLVAASGNSLRALIKYLDKVPASDIMNLNIPLAIPLVYELDDRLRPIRHYYLADKKKLAREIARVAGSGDSKINKRQVNR